jgi:lipopolysaccharide/colanic/teichoic acid biosynthesis glycosyltransferase
MKFRTRVHNPERPVDFPDPKLITTIGRALRRTSLDELPQGPAIADQVARYDEQQRGGLAVRPGLTGLAQVAGRNALTWPQRIELDLEYVRRHSVLLDLWILVRTVGVLFSGSGVEGHPIDDPIAGSAAR